jgi:hypothetical protein
MRRVAVILWVPLLLAVWLGGGGPAGAVATDPAVHWPPNPYLHPDPHNRSVGLIDNTGDNRYQPLIQLLAQQMNAAHNSHNLRWPAFFYYANVNLGSPDPCANPNPGFLVLCKSAAPSFSDFGLDVAVGANHIRTCTIRFNPGQVDVLTPGDRYTVIAGLFGRCLGLAASPNPASALNIPTVLNGQFRGYIADDSASLDALYGHLP